MTLKLNKSGTIYLQFYDFTNMANVFEFSFFTFFIDEIIDIDLSEKIYYKKANFFAQKQFEPIQYKVKNLKENKYVFFNHYHHEGYFYNMFSNPFEICNDKTKKCTKNIRNYEFLEGNEYTIYINSNYESKEHDYISYFYPSYMFFPIFPETFELIEEGYYIISEPKIFIVNLLNKGDLYLYFENAFNNTYKSNSNEIINLNNLNSIVFKKAYFLDKISEKDGIYGIILVSPLTPEKQAKVIITNHLLTNYTQEYEISEGENALIFLNSKVFENEEEEFWKNRGLDYNYIITTFSSETKNMKIISSNEDNYDFITLSYFYIPKYVDKINKKNKITIKKYPTKYAYFAAINNDLIKSYLSIASQYSIYKKYFNLDKLFPLSFRVNTDSNSFYDFINFYTNESEKIIDIYFKKIYGHTDIYECECNSKLINNNDLSLLTKPISFCENKKSILNKLYNFDGTKLLTGYISPNSYFDIYIDLIDNYKIQLTTFPLVRDIFNNPAKYLHKKKEYTLDFNVDHLIKLEPGFDTNVCIYNKYKTIIINSTFPTAHIKGSNLRIKSDDDAMVYFYGKLNKELFLQTKIEPESGKNIEIKVPKYQMFLIDFGFEGYNPRDLIVLKSDSIYYENDGNLFIENIYDKLKTKLVKNEFLYFYYSKALDYKFEIQYSESLNNPNNEYTFIVVPRNEVNKTLIINNFNKQYIKHQIYFCQSPHNVTYFYQSGGSNKFNYTLTKELTSVTQSISLAPFKLRFQSEEDFIYCYSIWDDKDYSANENKEWKKEREVLTNLYIENLSIKKINNELSNIISINFYPNYKASSTRYIIAVTPKTKNKTFDIYLILVI